MPAHFLVLRGDTGCNLWQCRREIVADWEQWGSEMASPSVEQAVRLVRQAVLQDSKRNYPEAARCYREAILTFRELRQSRSSSRRLQELLATKLGQYEARLQILEQHLLSTADLTKFFKDLKPNSCRSSVSSETRQLYKNPLLARALDLLKRGRQEDERANLPQALVCYESGLAALLDVLRQGHLTERQTESARVKCLLYHERTEAIRSHLEGSSVILERGRKVTSGSDLEDSDCDSPAPRSEDERMMQMEEVVSTSSRLGSTQSLFEDTEKLQAASRTSSCLCVCGPGRLATQPSIHSLYPTCEIKHSPSVLSVHSCRGAVPLAKMDRELDLSCLSLHCGEVKSGAGMDTEQIIVLHEDGDESYELIRLKGKDEDDGVSQSSDSGYSDPSPDSKSPGSEEEGADRKSPFSDISEELQEEVREIAKIPLVPDIIVVKDGSEGRVEQLEDNTGVRRQFGRQKSRFQTVGKDILISQESQDGVAVLGEDQVDMARAREPEQRISAQEVYGRRVGREERVPVRAEARGEHENMNMGCYYLMAALDFCWCL